MQTTNNINSLGFEGKFLSEKTVTKAIETSKRNFIRTKYTQGKAFEKTELDVFDIKGSNILENLRTLAKKLPEDFDLVLEKTKDWSYGKDAFCLNIRHKGLDDTEVFGDIRHHHMANVRENFMDGYSLEGIEIAINGWELLNPQEMVSRYVSFICRRLKNAVEDGKTRKLQNKLTVVDNIIKDNRVSLTAKTERTGIDTTLAKKAEIKKNRISINLYKLKRALGIEK